MSEKKVVFVNGVFDLFHAGHVALLKTAHAKACGGFVVVNIDSDARATQLKGPDRPVVTEQDRKIVLEACKYVDLVEIFDSEQELEDNIKFWAPDVMVKGEEYACKPIIGAVYCKELFFHESTSHRSTETAARLGSRGSLHRPDPRS